MYTTPQLISTSNYFSVSLTMMAKFLHLNTFLVTILTLRSFTTLREYRDKVLVLPTSPNRQTVATTTPKEKPTQKNLTPANTPREKTQEYHLTPDAPKEKQQKYLTPAFEDALSRHLSVEEKTRWFAESWNRDESEVRSKGCPRPIPFEKSWNSNSNSNSNSISNEHDVAFTSEQKNALRLQFQNGSKTIRDVFLPWIERDGFHPDLIFHGGRLMELLVAIIDGKVHFVVPHPSKIGDKLKLVAEHLESVMYEFHKKGIFIPDVIFPYLVGSMPPSKLLFECSKNSTVPSHLQDRYDTIPVAGIATITSKYDGVFLVPNMYFQNLESWDQYTKQLLENSNFDVPWQKRRKRMFYRGKIADDFVANIPRLEAMQAAARNADADEPNRLFDIEMSDNSQGAKDCSMIDSYIHTVNRTSSQSPLWVPKEYFYNVSNCKHKHGVAHTKYTNYWAQLNLPGSAKGSYSRNLQNLWSTGAAVAVWDQEAIEFYYDSIEAGVTHVWVNGTNVEFFARKLFENKGELARLMGSNARKWFRKNLTKKAILDYYKQWFNAWASLQRFIPSLEMIPGACTCAGWSDKKKKNDKKKKKERSKKKEEGKKGPVPKRCSFCANYPADVKKQVQFMLWGGQRGAKHPFITFEKTETE